MCATLPELSPLPTVRDHDTPPLLHVADKDAITADDVLKTGKYAQSPRQKLFSQKQLIKQQLHSQNVKLRTAFIHHDVRLTGSVPSYLIASCVKAGGLELSKACVEQAKYKYMTGDGRFNWELFTDEINNSREKSWSEAAMVKSADAFKQIDADGSGQLSRDELSVALKRYNVNLDGDQVDKLIQSCDADGNGDISYSEFVDGLARELVTPTSVFGRMAKSSRGPRRQ